MQVEADAQTVSVPCWEVRSVGTGPRIGRARVVTTLHYIALHYITLVSVTHVSLGLRQWWEVGLIDRWIGNIKLNVGKWCRR